MGAARVVRNHGSTERFPFGHRICCEHFSGVARAVLGPPVLASTRRGVRALRRCAMAPLSGPVSASASILAPPVWARRLVCVCWYRFGCAFVAERRCLFESGCSIRRRGALPTILVWLALAVVRAASPHALWSPLGVLEHGRVVGEFWYPSARLSLSSGASGEEAPPASPLARAWRGGMVSSAAVREHTLCLILLSPAACVACSDAGGASSGVFLCTLVVCS
jgi:hypothetical protein